MNQQTYLLVTNLIIRSSLLMVYVSAFGQVYFTSVFHFFLLWNGEINASPADLIGLLWASNKQTHMKYLWKLWGALHWLGINVEKCFPSGSVVKNPLANAGDAGLFPGLGRSPGEGKGYPLQYSGLKNCMDCIVHAIAKSWTRLSDFHFTSLHLGKIIWRRKRQPIPVFLLGGLQPMGSKKVRDNLGTKQQKCRKVDQTWREVLPWINGIMCWLISTALLDSMNTQFWAASWVSLSLCISPEMVL